jgi:hypothetical protein
MRVGELPSRVAQGYPDPAVVVRQAGHTVTDGGSVLPNGVDRNVVERQNRTRRKRKV